MRKGAKSLFPFTYVMAAYHLPPQKLYQGDLTIEVWLFLGMQP
jgi:hypothetical protein